MSRKIRSGRFLFEYAFLVSLIIVGLCMTYLITQRSYGNTNVSRPDALHITTQITYKSWQSLDAQQFCSIHANTAQQHVLQAIFDLQFSCDCTDTHTTFIILDVAIEATRGLGASLYGTLSRYLTIALQLNRTLLFHGRFDWTTDSTYCAHTNAMECYFLPLSHCDPIDILSRTNRSNPAQFYSGKSPMHCIFGDNNPAQHLSHCSERVLYINRESRQRPLLVRAMNQYSKQEFGVPLFEFEAIVTNFLVRPQPNVAAIIREKVRNSMSAYDVPINASQYISFPIRASDKCKNIADITQQHFTHKPEAECFSPAEYMLIMNVLQTLSPTPLQGVILTSEDASFLNQVADRMKHDQRSLVAHWHLIRNTQDFSVGEGTTTYRLTQRRFNQPLDARIGSSLETDHIVSALSSLVLQTHLETAYLVSLYESSWTELMWNWAAVLNCNQEPTKHQPLQNKCVQLLTDGYLHRRKRNKIRLSRDMFEKVQTMQLSADQFYDEFGVWYAEKSWCSIESSQRTVGK